MKHLSALLLTLAVGTAAASALTVDATPGKLKSLVGDASTTTQLTVTGSINAADLSFIADNMTGLESLDLSGATLSEYDGVTLNGHTAYPANTIPSSTFAGTAIKSVTLPVAAGLVIGDGAFACSGLESITLGSNIASVGVGAFAGCEDLTAVTLQGAPAVPDNAFYGCKALASVTGSQLATTVGASAFAGCSALKEFQMGPSLTAIGDNAFDGAGLERADFTQSAQLASIGAWAFANEPDLEEILFKSDVPSIGEGAFFNCANLTTINPSVATQYIPAYAFAKDAAIASDHILGESVTSIGDYAFKGASSIREVTLSPGMETIGTGAMEGVTSLVKIDASALGQVPALGENVWSGIDQSVVQLFVSSDMIDAFRGAEQWKEFNIVEATSGPSIAVDYTGMFSCKFVGDMLVVKVDSEAVDAVALYSLAGNMLASKAVAAPGSYAIDVAPFADRVFVVAVHFADGSIKAIKVAR